MKIYTKTGDQGQTSLIGGTRVSKADLRLETYGTADELNSYVGWLRAQHLPEEIDKVLHTIQNKLFNLGAYLATDTTKMQPAADIILTEADVYQIETSIDCWSEDLPILRGFILPAGNERVAIAHICRTTTRRLERNMVALLDKTPNDLICLRYINRLSDLFFILAKKIAQIDKCDIFLWEK